MLIFPAIDLRGGKCVRLLQGRAERETVYASDPVAMARHWVARGATWLHVVDLDGAFAGEPRQLPLVARMAEAAGVPVQLGGGLRTLEQVKAALAGGVTRVILGTVAVSRPEVVEEACAVFGSQRILVGLDATGGLVSIRGWQEITSRRVLEVALELRSRGVERLVFTDTSRDGMLSGPNLRATGELARQSGMRVIASGGISSLQDLKGLRGLEPDGVEGAILGKALYEGRIRLEEAIAVASGQE